MSTTPTTGAPFLDFMPAMTPQTARLEAARLAVAHHSEEGSEDAELVGTANALAAFIREEPFKVEIRWPDDEHIVVLVDGNTIATAEFDENGSSGLLAVEKAAVGVARALGVEPEWFGPGRYAHEDGGEK